MLDWEFVKHFDLGFSLFLNNGQSCPIATQPIVHDFGRVLSENATVKPYKVSIFGSVGCVEYAWSGICLNILI